MAVATRTIAELADATTGAELQAEYQAAVEAISSEPTSASIREFAALCCVAIARVKILEAGL